MISTQHFYNSVLNSGNSVLKKLYEGVARQKQYVV